MQNTFPKDILDCMKECILSIFWAKKDIIDFFENNGCTSREMIPQNQCDDMSRNRIIETILNNLNAKNDKGIGQLRAMLKSLTEWDYFNPYFFDEIKKLDKQKALNNIAHLKKLQEVRDNKIKRQRTKIENLEPKSNDINTILSELKNEFILLFQGKDTNNKQINLQQRGYLFESFLRKLFLFEKLEVTEPFKILGEQIDGSIKFEGEHYIVEAKWNDKLSASSDLYQFAHKVEGKMYGRGIFISVNGYSDDSVKALQQGKAQRTILIDGGDIVLITEGMYTFLEMLDKKIKAAQTMGRIYVNPMDLNDKIKY